MKKLHLTFLFFFVASTSFAFTSATHSIQASNPISSKFTTKELLINATNKKGEEVKIQLEFTKYLDHETYTYWANAKIIVDEILTIHRYSHNSNDFYLENDHIKFISEGVRGNSIYLDKPALNQIYAELMRWSSESKSDEELYALMRQTERKAEAKIQSQKVTQENKSNTETKEQLSTEEIKIQAEEDAKLEAEYIAEEAKLEAEYEAEQEWLKIAPIEIKGSEKELTLVTKDGKEFKANLLFFSRKNELDFIEISIKDTITVGYRLKNEIKLEDNTITDYGFSVELDRKSINHLFAEIEHSKRTIQKQLQNNI